MSNVVRVGVAVCAHGVDEEELGPHVPGFVSCTLEAPETHTPCQKQAHAYIAPCNIPPSLGGVDVLLRNREVAVEVHLCDGQG